MSPLLKQQLISAGIHVIENVNDVILEMNENVNINNLTLIGGLIIQLIKQSQSDQSKRISLECPGYVLDGLEQVKKLMKKKGERSIFKKDLSNEVSPQKSSYKVWDPEEPNSIDFLTEVMESNEEKTRQFLQAMKTELPCQYKDMYTVCFNKNEPIGIVFPHIEPFTQKQGRLFWIGIHQKYRGMGFGKELHQIGLWRLREDFGAKSYLGATRVDNYPMIKIMKQNGCHKTKHHVMSMEMIFKSPL